MPEDINRHCSSCLCLESEHKINLGSFRPCPAPGKDMWSLINAFTPATNLEYLEKKADETIR